MPTRYRTPSQTRGEKNRRDRGLGEFVDLSHMPDKVDAVRLQVEREGRALVLGRPGTGCSTLAGMLGEAIPRARHIDLPPLGADAAFHGLVQTAAVSGAETVRSVADNGGAELQGLTAAVVQDLAGSDSVLILKIPLSWIRRPTHRGDARVAPFRDRAYVLLKKLIAEPGLRLVVMLPYATKILGPLDEFPSPVSLTPVQPLMSELLDDNRWGPYSEHARKIHSWFHGENTKLHPLAIRLAVGLLALGVSEEKAEALLRDTETFSPLQDAMVSTLKQPQHLELARGLRRVAHSRYPLDMKDAKVLADLPEEHEPLLTQCAGYGNGRIRMNDRLRGRLLSGIENVDDSKSHLALSKIYHANDGAAHVAESLPNRVVNWLERVHHLGQAGPEGADAWSEIECQALDLLWDRARSLSRDYRAYDASAALYRRCIEIDPESSYSWHYLAYNLERSGGDRLEIEMAYNRAIEHDPDNPWWNGRYVRSLIRAGRFSTAVDAWRSARRRVLQDSGRSLDRWLAENFHLPVAHAWLGSGRAFEAGDILREIKQDNASLIDESADLTLLDQQVRDAEESEQLGESVYPPEYPMRFRWRRPDSIPDELDDMALSSWHPARVVEVTPSDVRIVFATTGDDMEQRRVLMRSISIEDWEIASEVPVDEIFDRRFFFVGVYGNDTLLIQPADRGFFSEKVIIRPTTSYEDLWRGAEEAGADEAEITST